jgi:hypothetical protein
MTLNEIFTDGGEFMDWLANNCYSCAKLSDDPGEYNSECELEPIIFYAALNEKIDDNLAQLMTENGKLCRCKNFIRAASKLSLFFIAFLALTGCTSEAPKPKVYTNKIEFHQTQIQKSLYELPKSEKVPDEYYKINFKEPLVAENKLHIKILCRLNDYEKSFIPVARKELKNLQTFIVGLKAEITEIQSQYEQLEHLQKQIDKTKRRIEIIKNGRQK